MRLLNIINNYIDDNEFKFTIYQNKIHIINYLEISEFSNTKIIIRHQEGKITIIGSKLVVSRMMDQEVLITGNIKNIELG